MLQMFLRSRASDEEIVHVRVAEMEATENIVDEALKCLPCISKAKWHVYKFEWCGQRSVVDVCRLYRNLMVGTYQVQLGEDGSTLEGGRKILDVWDRIAVWNGDAMECTIIATWTPIT